MRGRTWIAFGLAVGLSASVGFAGARAMAAAAAKPHFEADAAEMDATQRYLQGQVAAAVEKMKKTAGETTAENSEANKKEREDAINAALKPLQDDSTVLLLQAHFLAIDSIADKTGEPAEQFIQQNIYDKLGIAAADVAKRRESSGLGHGGMLLGYLIAKVSKAPADEVFNAKQENRSWPEVMKLKNVTPTQVFQALENKDQ
jgi:hypothetical protein